MESSPADVPKHPRPVHRMTRQMVGRRVCALLALCVVVALSACGAGGANGGGPARVRADDPASRRAVLAPDTAPARAPEAPRIVVLGDSLTAGLGLPADLSFPARLQAMLDEAGYPLEVVNAGESGGTSAGGLRRLERSLEGDVRVLVLALGANDGLRGLAVDEMKANLAEIIQTAQARGAAVLLAGMEAPPNLGSIYTTDFRDVFRDLSEEYDTAFVPFLLAGVAGVAELNQADEMHPNAEGASMVADLLWPALEPLLAGGATP